VRFRITRTKITSAIDEILPHVKHFRCSFKDIAASVSHKIFFYMKICLFLTYFDLNCYETVVYFRSVHRWFSSTIHVSQKNFQRYVGKTYL